MSMLDFEEREERAAEERGEDSAWFVVEVDGDPIGLGGLHEIDYFQQRCELGIRLGREHWGRGLGQDAVRVLVDYAFRHLAVRKVSLEVLADDPRATLQCEVQPHLIPPKEVQHVVKCGCKQPLPARIKRLRP